MKKFLIYLSTFLILIGASVASAGVYIEAFDDEIVPDWWTYGDNVISDGILHMYDGIHFSDGIVDSGIVFENPDDELIDRIEAEIYVSSNQNHMAGLTYDFGEPEPGYAGQGVSIMLSTSDNYAEFWAVLEVGLPDGGQDYHHQIIGVGTADEWHHFSITVQENLVTIGIDGNNMNLFEGLFQNPEKFNQHVSYVHGSAHEPNTVDYKVDNVKVYTSPTIDNILESVEDWIDDGELVGTGEGASATGRSNAFENMLQNARDLFKAGDIAGGCDQLAAAYGKCDGQSPPPDFVIGDEEVLEDLQDMITTLMSDFGCE